MILSSIYNIAIFVITLTMLYGLATMCTQHTLAGGGLLSGGLHVSKSYLTIMCGLILLNVGHQRSGSSGAAVAVHYRSGMAA